jgi:hypothetical protein
MAKRVVNAIAANCHVLDFILPPFRCGLGTEVRACGTTEGVRGFR